MIAIRLFLAHNVLQVRRSPHHRVPGPLLLLGSTCTFTITHKWTRNISRGDRQEIRTLYVSPLLELMFDRLGHCAR